MPKGNHILAGLIFLFSFALYLFTLAPTFIPIDSAEFTLCMVKIGICHPPGFFLYILVGKIFLTIWPFGSLIYRANVLSAIFGAATVTLVFQILKNLKLPQTFAILLTLLLTTASFFWQFSLAADIFTFGAFLVAASLYCWVRLKYTWSFLFLGLACSHYYIPGFLLPVFLYFSFSKGHLKKSINYLGFFLLGFIPQVLMFIRMNQNPEINWGHVTNLSTFINYALRREFGSIFINANPLQVLTISNFWNNLLFFWFQFLLNFGVVLPLLMIFGVIYKKRKNLFWESSFLVVLLIQIFTISTLNPFDAGRVFQTEKFLLLPAVIGVVLIGIGLNIFLDRFKNSSLLVTLVLVAGLILNLTINFSHNSYQNNYFSQNLVEDALSQLPPNSLAIIVTHQIYFGGLYEQKVLGKYPDIELVYFPNALNRDPLLYHPPAFQKPLNQHFYDQIVKQPLNVGESEMVNLIARNLNRPTFIKQGGFENVYFQALLPYLTPYGLWWQVNLDKSNYSPINDPLLSQVLKNQDITKESLLENNEREDALSYSLAHHSLAIFLGQTGKYDLAIKELQKAQFIDPSAPNFNNEINLLTQTRDLETNIDQLIAQKGKISLNQLGQNYLIIGNIAAAIPLFEKVGQTFPEDAKVYSNLGVAYTYAGKNDLAKQAFEKALQLDPNLEFAKNGLEKLNRP